MVSQIPAEAQVPCPSGTVQTGVELVVNSDFSAGNSGFTSGYLYCNTGGCLYPEATYTVAADPTFYHSAFTGKDHTTGTGNYQIINGAGTPNTNVWCETINVDPNSVYVFSAWVSTQVAGSPAELQFSINGVQLGTVFNAPNNINNWKQFSESWNSGGSNTATICIVNQNTALGGNDFGLDDISFQKCNCTDTIDAGADTSVCNGEPVTLDATVSTGSVSWNPAFYVDCDTCAQTLATPSATTDFVITLTNGICTVLDTVSIIVHPPVMANAGADQSFCEGDFVTLSATGGVSYEWLPQAGLSNPFAAATEAQPELSTQYTVMITDVNGCTGSDSVLVTVLENPVADAGPGASLCAGESYPLFGSGGDFYQWFPDDGLSDPEVSNPTASPQHTMTYVLQVTSANGCTDVDTVQITVFPEFQGSAGTDTTVCAGEPVQFFASGGELYQWEPATGLSCTQCDGPLATLNEDVVYTVLITDSNGCTQSDTVQVTVIGSCDFVDMPTAFSPNGDGINDLLQPLGIEIASVEFHIFNRWGQRLFSSYNAQDGWNGTFENKDQPIGVYAWWLKAVLNDGQVVSRKGNVTLVR